jgi:hypothetical protein
MKVSVRLLFLKTGKEAARCVPAFQVGIPKDGQATLYVIFARAFQSGYAKRRVECGGLTAVVVSSVGKVWVYSDRVGPWVGGRMCGEASSVAVLFVGVERC